MKPLVLAFARLLAAMSAQAGKLMRDESCTSGEAAETLIC